MNQLQMGAAQPFMGTQMPQQMPTGSQPSMIPGMQPPIGPMGNTMQGYPVQQAQYQQPIVQQPIMQPPPIRQPQTPMQSWPQAQYQQNQRSQPATASYPASAQYR
jgi:hypothetical protein